MNMKQTREVVLGKGPRSDNGGPSPGLTSVHRTTSRLPASERARGTQDVSRPPRAPPPFIRTFDAASSAVAFDAKDPPNDPAIRPSPASARQRHSPDASTYTSYVQAAAWDLKFSAARTASFPLAKDSPEVATFCPSSARATGTVH